MANAPSKKIKEICNKLGEPYIIKIIDGENVIYRSLNDKFDFEISNLDNTKKSFDAILYVWKIYDDVHIIEKFKNISSFEELRKTLDFAISKYSDITSKL